MPPTECATTPTQARTIRTSAANPVRSTFTERVRRTADTSHSSVRKPNRSGRKPLPIPRAHAPQMTNGLSPFQARHAQYAVSNENNASHGRSGPSNPDSQKAGFRRSNTTAASPTQGSNMRFPRANIRGRQSPVTKMETTRNVVAGSPKKTFTPRAKATKYGYPGGWG